MQTREKPLQNVAKGKDGQSPVRDESALKSKIFGVSGTTTLEGAIASIIAETFAEEVSKAARDKDIEVIKKSPGTSAWGVKAGDMRYFSDLPLHIYGSVPQWVTSGTVAASAANYTTITNRKAIGHE